MTDNQRQWARAKDELNMVMRSLGFPDELGDAVARQLGSPRAIQRMISYMNNVKPQSAELVVDEMLAIQSEIEAWRQKKAAEEANAAYNDILYYGLGTDEEE